MYDKMHCRIYGNHDFKCIYGIVFVLFCVVANITGYKLTITHTSDIHARFEQFDKYGADCSVADASEGNCFGGVARRYSKIQEIRDKHDNVLLLDAGDQFTGTSWFTVHRGKATSYFMNLLGYDAMCLGHHEFDHGVDGVRKFLSDVRFPVLSANIDVTDEPQLRGRISKSIYTTIGGEKIGIVGYITTDTSQISKPGPTVRFNDILTSVKDEVSELRRNGVNQIIALGHAGFDMDKLVAAIDGVDVVVGAHTHTFLYNGFQPADEKIDGPYPYVAYQPSGNRGLVVQAYTMGKYLGYLNLVFDSDGVVTNYSGQPILLGSNVKEDEMILSYVKKWREPVTAESTEAIGFSNVYLDGEEKHCRLRECNLGNLVTDAIIDYHLNFSHAATKWAPAAIALWNGGGIRASIVKGLVTVGEAIPAMPFENTIDVVTVKGKNLRDQLEISVQILDEKAPHGRFLQMSGLRVVYNMRQPVGQRLVSVETVCLQCSIPSYSPLIDTNEYNIFLSSFIMNGGDGYTFKPIKRLWFDTTDLATIIEYFKKRNPVVATVEGMIQFLEHTASAAPLLFVQSFLILVSLSLYALL